jgi:hypothetical protein
MSIARDVMTVGAATLTSRALGFLRDAGVAAVLGAGYAQPRSRVPRRVEAPGRRAEARSCSIRSAGPAPR